MIVKESINDRNAYTCTHEFLVAYVRKFVYLCIHGFCECYIISIL